LTDQLIHRILRREPTIGVIGLGYVGLPFVLRICEESFHVLEFDVDPNKVAKLKKGTSYLKSIPSSQISPFVRTGRLDVTDDFSRLSESDCILICVPTPLTEKMEPDLQYIEKTTEAIVHSLRKRQLIVLESTTYPGTTEELLLPRLDSRRGKTFFSAFHLNGKIPVIKSSPLTKSLRSFPESPLLVKTWFEPSTSRSFERWYPFPLLGLLS
jgi:UDP-N-acetyl-D-glucosamine dehydrogenase